jgi:sterol desaturase/sphingolipid hydroxylase (fatty acid hydroxylase superfamily)
VFTLFCGIVLWFGRSPAEIFQGTYDWFSDLESFFVGVYSTQNFQLLVAMLPVGLVLERLFPARRVARSNGLVNVVLSALMLLFQSALVPVPAFISEKLAQAIGGGYRLNLAFDTGDSLLLAVAAMLMATLLFDFFFYWFHRWQHASRIVWQEHAVHHSDVAFNVTTTQRAHFFEFILTPIAVGVPTILLFDLPIGNLVIITLIPSIWVYFVHMNIPLGFGRLWWLLTSPQYHRIHHSIEPEHRDKNFALFFPLLDVVFGTAYAPRRGEFPETGVEGVEVSTLADTFAFPFVSWYRMAMERFGNGSRLSKPAPPGNDA